MSASHDEFAGEEPIRGLPALLPAGERILWQGTPLVWEVAKEVFHLRAIGVYLFALAVWRAAVHADRGDMAAAAATFVGLTGAAIVAMGLVLALAWLCARTSVYTITTRRIVLRVGIALPTAVNLPFRLITAAGLNSRRNGCGDICLTLDPSARVGYVALWPHIRPWRLANPEPMLRGIANVAAVGDILGVALEAAQVELKLRPAAMTPPRVVPSAHVGIGLVSQPSA